MPTVIHHPIKFRMIRGDQFEVEKDGKRVGSLSRVPENAERNAGRWIFWQDGQPPSPAFRDLEEAQQAVGDLF